MNIQMRYVLWISIYICRTLKMSGTVLPKTQHFRCFAFGFEGFNDIYALPTSSAFLLSM